jgi:5'-nucleotidase
MTEQPTAPPGFSRILLSNDDGVAAPGLKVLEKIARSLSRDVWISAPEQEQSGAGHSLTLRRPLRIHRVGPKRFAVDGTPTDAVLLAIRHLLPKKRPSLLLSGVNRGGNLGEDVTYSGTVSAAMEGTLLGVPSIALSQQVAVGGTPNWDCAAVHGPGLITALVAQGWPADVLINVNFPDRPADQVRGVRVARQGRRKLGEHLEERFDARGEAYYWIGTQRREAANQIGSDLEAVNNGYIAVTPLHLDMTHYPTLDSLNALADPYEGAATAFPA